jgi:hypothetical protein
VIVHDLQQGTPEWFAARLGIPTASSFSRLITSTGARSKSLEGYAAELAAEVFAGKSLDQFDGNNAWMERGKVLEAEAVELYQFITDADVQRVGFCTNDEATAGCSPDALVGDGGGLEIKCLKAESHIAALHYYQKHGKCPSGYVQQVQGSLLVTGRAWWDLCFYHPDVPHLVIHNTADPIIQTALKEAITAVGSERDAQVKTLRHQQEHIPEAKSFTDQFVNGE